MRARNIVYFSVCQKLRCTFCCQRCVNVRFGYVQVSSLPNGLCVLFGQHYAQYRIMSTVLAGLVPIPGTYLLSVYLTVCLALEN